MEIIPIDSESIKICLSAPDMQSLDISCENMDYSNTETRRALWQVLDKVKLKTGFDAANGRLEVRMLQAKGGGCELFVKKSNSFSGGKGMGYTKENYRITPERTERTETSSYRFENIDMLALACRQLNARSFTGESLAYFDGNKYFLILSDIQKATSSRLIKSFSFLSEFGQKCDALCADAYIKEHFSCICDKNAVKIIAENC